MTVHRPPTGAPAPDGGLEPFPDGRTPRWGRRLGVVVAVGLALALVTVAVAAVVYFRAVDPPGPAGAEVKVTVPRGASTQRIGAILDQEGVVSSARAFRLYLRVNGGGPFQAGEYTFKRNMAMDEAVAVLAGGPQLEFQPLTVPEGLTLPQIAARVGQLEGRSAEAFNAALASNSVRSRYQPAGVTSLEGLLLPETYNLEPRDDEASILARMVRTFDETASALGYDGAQEAVGLSPYEAVVVASLIERETRFDDERAKVAQVIYNRLRKGMALQIDATVIYALGKSADSNVRVLLKDLEVDSPYNTYRVPGLPPTPIAAPGRASLEAALDPEPGPFLYYVVTEADGRHSFATTGAEHQANIRKAQANGVR